MHSHDAVPDVHLQESQITDRLFKLAESKNPYELSCVLDELATHENLIKKIIILQNQQGMTILHVVAKFQRASLFNKLLKMSGRMSCVKELNRVALHKDLDQRNLLHHVARYQTFPEIKFFTPHYPLDCLTQELEAKTIMHALFQRDTRGETPLAIIARRQPNQLYNIMKVARSANIHLFQAALFKEYSDGKIPPAVLNQYLNIINEMSGGCDHTQDLWDDFFRRVDKNTLDRVVAAGIQREDERGKLLAIVARDDVADVVSEFKSSMAEFIAELDGLPHYRQNCFGAFFHIPAVNYAHMQGLRNLIYNRTQTNNFTSANIHLVKNEIYEAISHYQRILIANQGRNTSRYLTSLTNFLNAAERSSLRSAISERMRG